jgi:HEAT repeat protein
LDGVSAYLSDEEQRLVWETGHPGLMDRALGSLSDAEIVLPIASDPNHALYSRSLDALAFGFESHQDLAIAALENGDPNVRASACKTLLWEEAIGATLGLIQCLDDPETDVRAEAENALQYFHDRRVFRSLLSRPGEALDSLSASFAFALRKCPELAEWMGDLLRVVVLDDTYNENDSIEVAKKLRPPRPFNVDSLIADVSRLGGEWAERQAALRNDLDWASLNSVDRLRLGRVLSEHIDPSVRSVAAYAFADWDDVNGLLGLMVDPNPSVVSSACFTLGRTSQDSRAALILEELLRGDSRNAQWGYLLTAFAHHGTRDAVMRFVEETLQTTDSEDRKWRCVSVLEDFGAVEEITALAASLLEAPKVSWYFHAAILSAARTLKVGGLAVPDIDQIDNLDMALAIAQYVQASNGTSIEL